MDIFDIIREFVAMERHPRGFLRRWGLLALCAVCGGAASLVLLRFAPAPRLGPRVVVLGIDGMDPKLTAQYIAAGRLPNLAALAQDGWGGALETVAPVQSPVVWTSMATGLPPAEHGVFDFITRQPGTYRPTLALTRPSPWAWLGRPFAPPVPAEMFLWERLHHAGVPVKVLRWPMTFPASGSATSLAGLGTPDVAGKMGQYSIFTREPQLYPNDLKGRLVALESHQMPLTLSWRGSQSAWGERSVAEVRVTQWDARGLTVRASTGEWQVPTGEWSTWIPLTFGTWPEQHAGMVRLLPLPSGQSIVSTAVHLDPQEPAFTMSQPSVWAPQLAAKIGRFHTLGMAEDTNALSDEVISDDAFLAMCDAYLDESFALFKQTFARHRHGLLAQVFYTIDRVQHMFWRYLDTEHARHHSGRAARYQARLRAYYERFDALVGWVRERLDPDETLLIVSDHGFTSFRRAFHVNAWLREAGYLQIAPAGVDKPLFAGVDWESTRAFALGFSQVFVNEQEVMPHGLVASGDVGPLADEIRARLLQLRDPLTGQTVVESVSVASPRVRGQAHLLLGLADGYRFSWQTAVGSTPAFVFEDNTKKWSGDHLIDPRFVPGVLYSSAPLVTRAPRVLDVAPTVMAALGVAPLESMVGRVLIDTQSLQGGSLSQSNSP